jgi:hypothetical protein
MADWARGLECLKQMTLVELTETVRQLAI